MNTDKTLIENEINPSCLNDVSASPSYFERELYKLINIYASAGLKKPDLVTKMEYVMQSCRVS